MITLKNWYRSFKEKFQLPSSQRVDVWLLLIVIGLVLFGLVMVYSSSFIYSQEKTGDGFSFIRRQLIFATLGMGMLWVGLQIPYLWWKDWAYVALISSIVLLCLIYVPGLGERVGGARRWLHLGALRFQPSELVKFSVIIFVARQLDVKSDRLNLFRSGVLAPVLMPLPALILLLLQPDFGTVVMICLVSFCLMFLSGVSKKYLGMALGVTLLFGAVLIAGSVYRRNRLLGFWDPWQDPAGKGFQIIQSFVGLHKGGAWGVGLGGGQEKLFFLPEAHNDFIFAVIGEELGFVGISAILGLYLLMIYRGLKIAWTSSCHSQERFGAYLATGITLALGLQAFVNIGVVLGLLPTKGLTLPLISYGGSALLVDLFALGILLNISKGSVSGHLRHSSISA